jgi:hypothetical protein
VEVRRESVPHSRSEELEMGEKSEVYFVISCGDGEAHISEITKHELEARLNDEWWGTNPTQLPKKPEIHSAEHSGLMFIKGVRIDPEPVEIVKRWEVS